VQVECIEEKQANEALKEVSVQFFFTTSGAISAVFLYYFTYKDQSLNKVFYLQGLTK